MQSSPTDSLYVCFERHLYVENLSDESHEEFVLTVVQAYIEELVAQGHHVPIAHLSSLEEELQVEVMTMLRTKTYGFYSIREFRDDRAKRNRREA